MAEFDVTLEFKINGLWDDVTRIPADPTSPDHPDDEPHLINVEITRGGGDEDPHAPPTQVTVTYFDPDSVLDGENPYSPYYGLIVTGTEMRVAIDGDIRAVVEFISAEPYWDTGHNKIMVRITGADLWERIGGAGLAPIRSPAYRALTSAADDAVRIAYVPLEEEEDATSLEVYRDVTYALKSGELTLGGDTNSRSSARLVSFGTNGKIFLRVPDYTSTEHKIVGTWRFPEIGGGSELPDNSILYELRTQGSVDRIWLRYGTGGGLQLQAYLGAVLIGQTATVGFGTTYLGQDQEVMISLEFTQNGADNDTKMFLITEISGISFWNQTLTGVTINRVTSVRAGHTDISGASFGQLAVADNVTAFGDYINETDGIRAVNGYAGESAGVRISRILSEENIPFSIVGTESATEAVGVQAIDSAGNLVADGAAVDMGILHSQRDDSAIAYRTRASLYNQVPVATVDYAHVSPPFIPTLDNNRLVNQVTASRSSGSSYTYTIPDGDAWHRTTEAPPDGVSIRPGSLPGASPGSDDQLNELAAWYAHVSSWKQKRVRTVTFELGRPIFDTGTERAQVKALNLGDVLAIDTSAGAGAPRAFPESQVRQLVRGYGEILAKFQHTITFNMTPADAYEVEIVDPGASELAVAVDSDDTTLRLATSLGPDWSVTGEPYHLQVGGEAMTVTAMVTETPSFIATGAAAHGVNASVVPGLPPGMTPDVGQLMLLFAGIRNSGTGTPNTPSGWDLVAGYTPHRNIAVYGRYYRIGDTAPTVSFNAGVAGADTSAIIAGFSGLSMELASGPVATPAAVTRLNSSAQDILYPLMRVTADRTGAAIVFAWKQDDSTAATTPTGFTNLFRESTTTGDDQTMLARYDLTAANVSAGTITMTGGAAAISRAMLFALRPLQTATVTRAVNGVSVSHAVGAAVRSWRPGVTAL